MDGSGALVDFATQYEPILGWIAIGLGALLLVAVAFDLIRRKKERSQRLDAEWDLVKDIARERELGDEEWALLHSFVERWSAGEPLRAVTVRQHFDECVEREMRSLEKNPDEYERRGVQLREVRSKLLLDYLPFGQRIHSTRELGLGQSLWLARTGEVNPNWMRGKVSAVDEGHFHVVPYAEEEGAPPFRAGHMVRCRMWREEDARYVFSAKLMRCEENPVTYVFRHADDLQRMQSRAHYRVRHDQPTTVGILNAPVDGEADDLHERRVVTKIRGRITSLSAGGFALVAQQPVPKQVLLRVNLEVPGAEPVDVEARIVSSAPISGGRYLIRGSYIGIDEETRDAIARYVMYRQQARAAADQEEGVKTRLPTPPA